MRKRNGTCVRVKYNDEVLIRTTAEFGADASGSHCRTAEDVRKNGTGCQDSPLMVQQRISYGLQAQLWLLSLTLILESMFENATGTLISPLAE